MARRVLAVTKYCRLILQTFKFTIYSIVHYKHRVPPTYTNWEGQKFFFARFAREFTILYPPLWNSWRRC